MPWSWCHIVSSYGMGPWHFFIMEVKVVRLEREGQLWWEKLQLKWSCQLSSPSFLGHSQCFMLLGPSTSKEWSQQLPMLFILVLLLLIIPLVYSAGCSAYLQSLLLAMCLILQLLLHEYLLHAASYVFVPLVVTLLTNLIKMPIRCVWMCHNGVTTCLNTVVDYTILVSMYACGFKAT